MTDWQIDRHNISRISLGPSNMVRLGEYLLGKADFPANVSLNVVVCDGVDKWDLLMTPPSGGNGNGFNHYHFLVPGVAFHLCVGQKILVELRSSCIATGSRPVLFMQSHEQFFANADAVLGRPRTLSKRLVQMIEENEER